MMWKVISLVPWESTLVCNFRSVGLKSGQSTLPVSLITWPRRGTGNSAFKRCGNVVLWAEICTSFRKRVNFEATNLNETFKNYLTLQRSWNQGTEPMLPMAHWQHKCHLISAAQKLHFCWVCVCQRGFSVVHVYTILECTMCTYSLILPGNWYVAIAVWFKMCQYYCFFLRPIVLGEQKHSNENASDEVKTLQCWATSRNTGLFKVYTI